MSSRPSPKEKKENRGIALIVIVGVLGIMALMAVAYVTVAMLERQASLNHLNASRAHLLARSGVDDALARLAMGQDPAYGGENWDGSGDGLLTAYEAGHTLFNKTVAGTPADQAACPVIYALRPSFFAQTADGLPALAQVDGALRGYSGVLPGTQGPLGNLYAIKVEPLNAGIGINGGALDAQDRDPDGPNAAPEGALLSPNGIPDHRDASMEGPNGFLVRLLNNLDALLSGGASAGLGTQVVGGRPQGGYRDVEDLLPVLGAARYALFKPYLSAAVWTDAAMVKPQPANGRPGRFQDIDEAHRVGDDAGLIAGVTTAGGGGVQLLPGVSGDGLPWSQSITATNGYEGTVTYPVGWERNFVYAWSQMRPGPSLQEARAPLSLNGAPKELLAAAVLGLKGTSLEVWDGTAGWDGGLGWVSLGGLAVEANSVYTYPNQATEESPWHRTRVDYGMSYGVAGRPWYGPASYNPHAPANGWGGKPVILSAPLGRLKESLPISRSQASAFAEQLRKRLAEGGPIRTWERFNAFVDALPRWEDLNDDGSLDGGSYLVSGSGGSYLRRMYQREDLNSDGLMAREVFTPTAASGSWALGVMLWLDPQLSRAAAEASSLAPGLTFVQKDVIKAMANPNTDLNDFNPDANLWKEVDKTDLAGIPGSAWSYAHTTELSLDEGPGFYRVRALGRLISRSGRLLAQRQVGALLSLGRAQRDSSQADFMEGYQAGLPLSGIFSAPAVPYALAGGQGLLSYPEPQTLEGGALAASAAYDGQIALGFIAAPSGPDETLRGDLFDTANAAATSDPAMPDLRGPSRLALAPAPGATAGNVFPDGVYSEKDRTLKYLFAGNLPEAKDDRFYVGAWVKPSWFPEASPRAHALISLSRGDRAGSYDHASGNVPTDDILVHSVGLYFVPARNNFWQDGMGIYLNNGAATRGMAWPTRSLIWRTPTSLYASDNLNRRGQVTALVKPVGRLEAHRWEHMAVLGQVSEDPATLLGLLPAPGSSRLILGRSAASLTGGGWNNGVWIGATHNDGTPNHLRFGEIAGEHNMNYMADATFAGVRSGRSAALGALAAYESFLTGAAGPGSLGRYLKENGAAYTSGKLPEGIRPRRITWTEIPADLWFDQDADGWLGDAAGLFKPKNDQFGLVTGVPLALPNGKRDIHIEVEAWDDMDTPAAADDVRLARYADAGAANIVPMPMGRLYYKAVFVSEWDAATQSNHPLDVTPFLDDVTVFYQDVSGPRILRWETERED